MRFSIRKANEQDRDLIFNWANDPVTRQNSFSTKEITYEEHCNWYENVLANEKIGVYIAVADEEPVGMLRLDTRDNEKIAEISYSVAPNKRGMGFGTKILVEAATVVVDDFTKVEQLVGLVKEENVISHKAFTSAGYDSYPGGYCKKVK